MQIFKTSPLPAGASLGILIVRVVAGVAFVLHGWGKIQNPMGWDDGKSGFAPALLALAALSEFGGGIAWILGFLTPLASFGIACTMGVATWLHAIKLGDPFVVTEPGKGSYEIAAVYLAISLLLLLAGPGKLSLDRLVFGEKSRGKPPGPA
jgi:putative oxidoreductase